MAPLEAWRHHQVLAPMVDPIFTVPLAELLTPPALPAPPPKPELPWQDRRKAEDAKLIARGRGYRQDEAEDLTADWRDRAHIERTALRRALIEAGL